jgi:two-component system, sensor histidine kinase PdtaS
MSGQHDRSSGADADNAARAVNSQWIARRAAESQKKHDASTTAKLESALAREAALLRDRDELVQRQAMLTQEFEHRLVNGLQMVVSLLSLQSQKTESPEAAAQLRIAARRVGAFGRVHRRLHLLDRRETVELKQYVEQLCQDLSGLLFDGNVPHLFAVEGGEIEIPTRLAIPLGFIVNELITNAAKHAEGEITVCVEATPEPCLSVSSDGPALPEGFDPGSGRGLGMKIIQSLVKEINGRLEVGPGPRQQGACFKVFFPATASSTADGSGEPLRAQKTQSADGQGMAGESPCLRAY